jgi:hypothetical protein
MEKSSPEETRGPSELRIIDSMKNGCLIQDLRRIDLNNLVTSKEGGSFVIGEVTNPNVSPSVGDASLVIDGEEFAGDVVRYTGSQVVFEPSSFDEIAKKFA